MVKIALIGAAGQIGTPLSLLCKSSDLFDEISLYDLVHVPGIATDLMHIDTRAKVSGYLAEDSGLKKALTAADIVAITAGIARKPGMTRDDLFKTNASIIRDIFTEVAATCPGATCCVVTNPVNSTLPIAAETLKKVGVFEPSRLFGIPVIGGHSGATILPLYSQAEPPVNLSEEVLAGVINRVQFGGDEIVKSKNGAGSATTCMAYAGFRFVKAILAAKNGDSVTEEAFVYLPGIPGGKGIAAEIGVDFFAVKIELGKVGAVKALPIGKISENESQLLGVAIDDLKKNIATALSFMST
ncbi:malate dehydrogenase [Penicillium malachiteum]|uniref:malate dehydrogenase n=1 Tax=Penicillium malachiteum TaxID=1324776 RepID=UPI00254856F7|nr:malate dehydrogenase [Penicillium malachiteum]KAJ5736368.1 malate dehydrogenase [Penicillium malachiteum]